MEEIIELKIPNLGEAEETEVIELSVSEGDSVNENDPLIVLESEKAAMEIPSDFKGKIVEVLVNEGEQVSEGQTFAKIKAAKKGADKAVTEKSSKEVEEDNYQSKTEGQRTYDFSGINAGPAVRKYARELDINLSQISGTGRNNRITKDDLKNFIHSKSDNQISFPHEDDFSKFGSYQVIKLSKIRALGAKNMSASWTTIPHVTHFEEAEMTAINEARSNIKISPLVFFIKIISFALEEHKIFNSSLLKNNEIVLKDYINIGVAVDTPDGLVVPVIKEAHRKNIQEISDELLKLAEKAKNKKLRTGDLEGSTFTVSSLGKIGGTGFTPIINAPEVAIIAISRTKKILKMDGSTVPKEIEVVPFSLSYDHRVINGADAGRFMSNIRSMIETYS